MCGALDVGTVAVAACGWQLDMHSVQAVCAGVLPWIVQGPTVVTMAAACVHAA